MLGSIGVVDPVLENVYEPLEKDIEAEAGRDVAGRLESRDLVMLVDKRRSHFCDWAFGVLDRELSLPSGGTLESLAIPVFPLVLLRLLFIMFAACSECERPKYSAGRAGNRSDGPKLKEKWSAKGAAYVAVAVALIAW